MKVKNLHTSLVLRFVVVLLVLFTLPLKANLGDSVEQCVKRYGKPVGFTEANAKTPFGTLVFVAGPYALVVFLLNNAEVGARVSKGDKTAFTEAELKDIMGADATTPWMTAESPDPADLRWSRADKSTVLYDKDKHVLIFTAPAMAEALRQAQANPAPPAPPSPGTPPPASPPVVTTPRGTFVPAAPAVWTAPAPPATNNATGAGG